MSYFDMIRIIFSTQVKNHLVQNLKTFLYEKSYRFFTAIDGIRSC